MAEAAPVKPQVAAKPPVPAKAYERAATTKRALVGVER